MKTIDEKANVIQIIEINGQIEDEERAGRAEIACRDKRSLWRKQALYSRAYSEAVGQLISVSSLATRSEWESAWDLAARARFLCVDSLNELQAHSAEHGC
jgi:hypothetical protein